MPKIVFKDVDVIYRSKKSEKVVFDHFNEEFLPDKTSVIVGFSGCGKSTLLRTLFDGVDYNGLITIDDKNIEDINIQDRELAYVSQEYVLYPHQIFCHWNSQQQNTYGKIFMAAQKSPEEESRFRFQKNESGNDRDVRQHAAVNKNHSQGKCQRQGRKAAIGEKNELSQTLTLYDETAQKRQKDEPS